MTKNTTADQIADPRTNAGVLINTLTIDWDGQEVNAMEIRYVEGAGNQYYVIALSRTDPDVRAFHLALPTARMAEDEAVALLSKQTNRELIPECGICHCVW